MGGFGRRKGGNMQLYYLKIEIIFKSYYSLCLEGSRRIGDETQAYCKQKIMV